VLCKYRNVKLIVIILCCLSLNSCESVIPLAIELVEATHSKLKVDKIPTTIETAITKKDGKVVVESSSPEHSSIVNNVSVVDPLLEPKFDLIKGFTAIPLWLIVVWVLSGTIFFINSVRQFRFIKKRGEKNDTSRVDNNGRGRSNGRSVQIHGSGSEKQSSANGIVDEEKSTRTRASGGGPRISIQIGRRSSK
jgi:hypothetical protein